MKHLVKVFVAAGITALALLPQVAGSFWWGSPGYGGGWRNAYKYDPAYRFGSPQARKYIRDLHRYGPAYAQWRQHRKYWW